jgi:hypothetical protein
VLIVLGLTGGCLGVSTRTDELDDTNLFWMNQSMNLKETRWNSGDGKMFLTRSDLSSLGTFAPSSTTMKANRPLKTEAETKETSSREVDVSLSAKDKTIKDDLIIVMSEVERIVDKVNNEIEVAEKENAVDITNEHSANKINAAAVSENDKSETTNLNIGTKGVIEEEKLDIQDQEGGSLAENPRTVPFSDGIANVIPSLNSTEDSNDTILVNGSIELVEVTVDEINAPKLGTQGSVDVDTGTGTGTVQITDETGYVGSESEPETVDGPVDESDNAKKDLHLDKKEYNTHVGDEMKIDNTVVNVTITVESQSEPVAGESPEVDSDNVDFDALDKSNLGSLELLDSKNAQDQVSTELDGGNVQSNDTPKEDTAKVPEDTKPDRATSETDPPVEKHTPKKGSLAEFFKKVSPKTMVKEESVLQKMGAAKAIPNDEVLVEESSATTSFTTTTDIPKHPKDVLEVGNLESNPANDDTTEIPYGYTTVWGRKRHDIGAKALQSIHVQMDLGHPASIAADEEIVHTATDVDTGSLDPSDGDETEIDVTDTSGQPIKSVNDEFVKGLDDINKLFEHVQPPDELDVGAAGSSMQEVLMGQGAQILRKRVRVGVEHVKNFFSQHRNGPESVALVPKKLIDNARTWLIMSWEHISRRVRHVVMDALSDGEDILDFDELMEEEESKLASLRQTAGKKLSNKKPSLDAWSGNKLDATMRQRLDTKINQ